MKKSKEPTKSADLPESSGDKKKMQREEIIMDLPEVKDIPGQENIVPPKLDGLADVTISSDDEEGKGIEGLDDDMAALDEETNVSSVEKELLEKSANQTPGSDDEDQQRATLDNVDEEGEELNEINDVSGRDLDVPGSEDDDYIEDIGEEDEENNSYSLGGDKD